MTIEENVTPCPEHHAPHAPRPVARTSDRAPSIPSPHGAGPHPGPPSPVPPSRPELVASSPATAASATSAASPAPTRPTTSSPSPRAAPTPSATCAPSTASHATPTRPATNLREPVEGRGSTLSPDPSGVDGGCTQTRGQVSQKRLFGQYIRPAQGLRRPADGPANGGRGAPRRPRFGALERLLAELDHALDAGADQLEAELEALQ